MTGWWPIAGARAKNRDQLAKLAGAYAPVQTEISHDVASLTGPAFAEAIRSRALELAEANTPRPAAAVAPPPIEAEVTEISIPTEETR